MLSVSAALLARNGIAPATALLLFPDTLRARAERAPTQIERDRASIRRGEHLLPSADPEKQRREYGVAVRRSAGELWVPEDARPRVHTNREGPDAGYFNPLVRLAAGAHRASPVAESYAQLAAESRRSHWGTRRQR